jgi:hypothetical protein
VADRQGDREISWEGAIKVVLVALLLCAAGALLSQWVTGRPGNIVGIPTVAAIFIIGAGFRWALNAPLPKVTEGPGGTRILNPRGGVNLTYAALASVALVTFAWNMLTAYGFPAVFGRKSAPATLRADSNTYSAERKMAVSSFIDFDTGKVSEEPLRTNTTGNFLAIGETLAWMESNGFDAAAANDAIEPLGMLFVPLEAGEWDTLAPKDLHARFALKGGFRPARLSSEQGSTFGFRTREGGTGILQLLASQTSEFGVTLRYKLAQAATQ